MRGLRIRVVGTLALSLVLVGVAPPSPGRAATPGFGAPTATSRFEVGVEFRQPIEAGDAVATEILIRAGDDPVPFVVRVPPPRRTPAVLEYVLDLSGGGAAPNTPLSARWRVTLADGSVEVGPDVAVTYVDDRFDWRTRGDGDVRVHWYDGSDAFGRRALEVAERGVEEAAALFGVTIEKRIDFFMYADVDAFYEAMGPSLRENVGGVAQPEIRTLFARVSPDMIDDPFVETVIPHELTHLVFDVAVDNPYHAPPKWLNEGIATYLSEGYSASRRADVRDAVSAGELMPLTALAGQFPTTRERFSLAYSETASAVDYLVRAFGRDAMVALVEAYADGLSDDAAFTAALGTDVAGFEAAWVADIGAALPEAYGPQPAPAGPVPSDWLGPGPTPGIAPGPSASTVPTAAPTPEPSAGGDGPDAGSGQLLVVLGLLAAAGVIVGAWTLRRRPPKPSDPT